MPRRKKVSTEKEKLADDDKIKLANFVSLHPCLWKLADPGYRKHDAVTAAWIVISEELGYKVTTCKDAWRSLKDGLRYYQGAKKKPGKSGDSIQSDVDEADENDHDEDKLNHWKFWESMKFVTEDRPTRSTLTSLDMNEEVFDIQEVNAILNGGNLEDAQQEKSVEIGDNEASANVENGGTAASPNVEVGVTEASTNARTQNEPLLHATPIQKKRQCSGNVYEYSTQTKRRKSNEMSTEDRIADSIQMLVDLRKADTQKPAEEAKLKYQTTYAFMDTLLQKLPEDDVDDLTFKFISMIKDAIKKQ